MIALLQLYDSWDRYLDVYFSFMENFHLDMHAILSMPISFRNAMIERKNEQIAKEELAIKSAGQRLPRFRPLM